ncbi:MAG: alpha/beta hydrolase [Gammaproteobacteria bacterium]|nr:MAG: alpha/beta hydrolase [Gammaproteobacteria bacterium]
MNNANPNTIKHLWHDSDKARYLNVLLLPTLLFCLSACSGLLFFPSEIHHFTPAVYHLDYQDIYIDTQDGEKVHGWYMHAVPENSNGTVLFLHGNAENISTHFANISWLPDNGYNVFALDYRGYGLSTGSPSLSGALMDIEASHRWLTEHPEVKGKPLYLLGQSIGASLSLTYAGQKRPDYLPFSGVIADAGFPSFPGIAKQKLAESWLTWPIQYVALLLIESEFDPERYIDRIAPTPLLIIHSQRDNIIPFEKGKEIYRLATQPKQFLVTNTAHTATFQKKKNRQAVLDFMQKSLLYRQ